MKQMILEITAGASFDAMPEELQGAIRRAKVSWPGSLLCGSEPVDGKQLILIMCGIEADELELWMNDNYPAGEYDENGDEITIAFGLDWSVLAVEGVKFTQKPILKYMSPLPILDEDNEVIDYKSVTSLRGNLQTFAGRKWTL